MEARQRQTTVCRENLSSRSLLTANTTRQVCVPNPARLESEAWLNTLDGHGLERASSNRQNHNLHASTRTAHVIEYSENTHVIIRIFPSPERSCHERMQKLICKKGVPRKEKNNATQPAHSRILSKHNCTCLPDPPAKHNEFFGHGARYDMRVSSPCPYSSL